MMKVRKLSRVSKLAVALAAVFALLPARAVSQDQASIVVNGDFEVPAVSNFRPFFPPGFEAWTVDAGSVDIVHELWTAASGVQSVDLNGNCCDPGSMFQDLPTTPGTTYILSFSFAGNPDPNPICQTSPAIKRMEVFWGAMSAGVFEFDTAGHTLEDPGWQAASLPVTAVAGTTRLRFTSLIPGACGPALDDVAVTERPDQPQRPGKGCGDKNHIHEHEADCRKPPT